MFHKMLDKAGYGGAQIPAANRNQVRIEGGFEDLQKLFSEKKGRTAFHGGMFNHSRSYRHA